MRAVVLLLTACWLAGCGYTTRSTFPADVNTVGVDIFKNQTYYKGLEFDLTEAVKKQIEATTPYKTVAVASADTVLQGTVVSYEKWTKSYTANGGLPQQQEVRLVVDFEWRDARTGRVLRERKGFEAIGSYVPARPTAEPEAIGQHEAVQRMADQIIAVMRSESW